MLCSPWMTLALYPFMAHSEFSDCDLEKIYKECGKLRSLISVFSFVMAVFGGLAVMFIKDREKQKMASIVAFVFLLSFFINISETEKLLLQIACLISFAMAILGGIVTVYSSEEYTRIGSMVIGIVSLGVSLLILFMYIEFR